MATGLFKIALVFASLVATIELSDAQARTNIDVFKSHPWDKLWGGGGISGDFERNKKKSRTKRFGFGRCYARYGFNKMIHISEDAWCGCYYPPCSCSDCVSKICTPIPPSKYCICSPSTPCSYL